MRILLVDDDSQNLNSFMWLLGSVPGLEFTYRPSMETALWAFQSGQYDLALIDVILHRGTDGISFDSAHGFNLAQAFRKEDKEFPIVLYSGEFPPEDDIARQIYQNCRDLTDHVIPRRKLFTFRTEQLGLFLSDVTSTKPQLEEAGVTFQGDFETEAILEVIDLGTASNLIRRCIPRGIFHRARTLGGGFSTALVFQVDTWFKKPEDYLEHSKQVPDLRNVVKVDRAIASLEREVSGSPTPGSREHEVLIGASDPIIYRHGGWGAFAQPYVDSVLLEDLLLRGPVGTTPELLEAFEGVISELIFPFAQGRLKYDDQKGEDRPKYQMRVGFGTKVLQVLREVSTDWSVAGEDSQRAAEHLANTVVRFLERKKSFSNRAAGFSDLHGDFHARNVLVAKTGSSRAIDLAHRGLYPRLFDFASLIVDLHLRVYGRDSGSHLGFEDLGGATDRVLGSLPFSRGHYSSGEESNKRPAIDSMLLLLDQHLTRVEDFSEREYSEALLFQVLRYLRFPNLGPGRRVLAIHWANSLVEEFKL